MSYVYGALKSKVDIRDYQVVAGTTIQFPTEFLCENLSPVKNQGSISSCVAHTVASILETFNKTETGWYVPMSTDFIYGMQGIAFGRKEKGMYLRDACKIAKQYGDATKETINGNTEQPNCTSNLEKQLTDEVYNEAKNYRIQSYASCNTNNSIKHALMNYGPVLSCVKWYNDLTFEKDVLKFNKTSESSYHAVMVCGWNEKGWICQNSWGYTWGSKGKFILPYEDEFVEAWSFVDAKNEDIKIPSKFKWLDILYKIINSIINFLNRTKN